MRIKLIIISFLILSFSANAQNYIMEYRFEKVKEYRDSINKKLINNNIEDIKVKRYFELEPHDTAYLAIDEEELLLLITRQYEILLRDILQRKTRFYKGVNLRRLDKKDTQAKEIYRHSKFYYDSLTVSIKQYLREYEQAMRTDILNSDLRIELKDFTLLLFDYYLSITDFCDFEQEQKMISDSRQFIKKYPHSEYIDFVDNYVNIEFKEGYCGIGMYFNMGTILYSGGLENYFSNPTLIYVSWDLNYRKFDLNLGMGGSIYSKIKQNFYYDTLWQRNHKYTFSPVIAATLGYHVYENKNLNITPFIGVRYLGLSGRVKSDSLYYEDIGLDSQNPLTFGLTFDYKFGHGTCKSIYMNRRGGYKERIFADLRFKIAYQNPQFNKSSINLKGGLWIATLGFGFNSYPPKRIMKRN